MGDKIAVSGGQTLAHEGTHGREGLAGRILGRSGRIFIILLFLIFILLPVFFIMTTSLKIPLEIRVSGAILPQGGVVWENWVSAFRDVPVLRYLLNSSLTAFLSAMLVLFVGVPVTYSMVRFRTGGFLLPSWILGTYVMPPIVVSIPIFTMVKMVGLTNTLPGLIIVHMMLNLPIAVWLMDSYVRGIPKELEFAAWIDGYSKVRTLVRVVVPLIKPGVMVAGIISLILSWNEFLFALILTYSEKSNTFPIGISLFVGEHGLQFGQMSAAALAGIIPIYIMVFFFSRNLVEGLTRGGLRG
ncbi:MAG: carbohydrate ABC transporter permease [Spirochaetia bacterium]